MNFHCKLCWFPDIEMILIEGWAADKQVCDYQVTGWGWRLGNFVINEVKVSIDKLYFTRTFTTPELWIDICIKSRAWSRSLCTYLQTSYCCRKLNVWLILSNPDPLIVSLYPGYDMCHDSPGCLPPLSAGSAGAQHLQRGPADAEVRREDSEADLSASWWDGGLRLWGGQSWPQHPLSADRPGRDSEGEEQHQTPHRLPQALRPVPQPDPPPRLALLQHLPLQPGRGEEPHQGRGRGPVRWGGALSCHPQVPAQSADLRAQGHQQDHQPEATGPAGEQHQWALPLLLLRGQSRPPQPGGEQSPLTLRECISGPWGKPQDSQPASQSLSNLSNDGSEEPAESGGSESRYVD